MYSRRFGSVVEPFDMEKVVFLASSGRRPDLGNLFSDVKTAGYCPLEIENDEAVPENSTIEPGPLADDHLAAIRMRRMELFQPKVVIWFGSDKSGAVFYDEQAAAGKTVLLVVSSDAKSEDFKHAAAVFTDSGAASRFIKGVGGIAGLLGNVNKSGVSNGSCTMPAGKGPVESNSTYQIRMEQAQKAEEGAHALARRPTRAPAAGLASGAPVQA